MAVRTEQPAHVMQHACDGEGYISLHTLLSAEEFFGFGKFLSRIVIKPGHSIGWHQHVGEAEYYYILSGHGEFTDSDESVHSVGPGDICTIVPGGSHAIANHGEEELVFLALIVYTEKH